MEPKYLGKLAERKEKGSLRSLSLFEGFTDFYSNDYLGLTKVDFHTEISGGSTGSRLISGNSAEAETTENFLAEFFGSEAALVFNSGYDANLGFFSSVPQKGDTVIYDELIHASVRDGIRLSHAKAFSFWHNDTDDLEKKIIRAEGTVFVSIESLYSMDGDFAPLEKIVEICEKHNALLIVDEAHSGGVFGVAGKGLMDQHHLYNRCFARLITFGKAYGTHGSVILGSQNLKDYLVNFARSFIYTTALPEYQYLHIRNSVVFKSDENRRQLTENIAYFRKKLDGKHLLSDPHSPIQIIPYSSIEECKEVCKSLNEANIAVKAILPPTVPEGGQRLRICLHSFNTQTEIDRLVILL